MKKALKTTRLTFSARSNPTLEEFVLPPMGEADVLVETLYSVISPGTERAFLLAEPNTATHDYGFPFVPGYSSIGRIIKKGRKVTDLELGQLICSMAPHQSHSVLRVPDLRQQHWGAVFDQTTLSCLGWVPAHGDNVDPIQLAGFMILAVAVYGVRCANPRLGDEATISGLGPIGLLVGQLAATSGLLTVRGIARDARLREAALRAGFDSAMDKMPSVHNELSSFGKHIVWECSGSVEAFERTLSDCPYGAHLVLLGCPRGVLKNINFYDMMQRKSLEFSALHQPSRSNLHYLERAVSQYRDAQIAIELIRKKKINMQTVYDAVINVREYRDVYKKISERGIIGAVPLSWKD